MQDKYRHTEINNCQQKQTRKSDTTLTATGYHNNCKYRAVFPACTKGSPQLPFQDSLHPSQAAIPLPCEGLSRYKLPLFSDTNSRKSPSQAVPWEHCAPSARAEGGSVPRSPGQGWVTAARGAPSGCVWEAAGCQNTCRLTD